MIVFVGNLPAEVTADDLVAVAQLAPGTPVKICKKQDGNGGRYRYGLVHLDSEGDGRKLIRRLHGTVMQGTGLRGIVMHGTGMQGNRLEARKFAQRYVSNERRRLDWRSVPWHGPERRKGERRAPD
jgi:hypothetical protein